MAAIDECLFRPCLLKMAQESPMTLWKGRESLETGAIRALYVYRPGSRTHLLGCHVEHVSLYNYGATVKRQGLYVISIIDKKQNK